MKIPHLLTLSLLAASVVSSNAQSSTKKLALTEVVIAPTLVKKIGAAVEQPSVQQRQKVEFLGVWKMPATKKGPQSMSYSITRQVADGSLHASLQDAAGGGLNSISVVNRGNHVSITFPPTYRMHNLEAEYDARAGKLIGNIGGGPRVELNCITPFPDVDPAPVVASPITQAKLDALTHQINIQFFDKFNTENLYSIISGADLKKNFPPDGTSESTPYEFGAAATIERFKSLNINYVLVTSLEDLQESTTVKQRTKDTHYQAAAFTRSASANWNASGVNRYNNSGSVQANGSGAYGATQGGFDPESWTEQNISISLRMQLFDADTGQLKKSANTNFVCVRNYAAAADQNKLSYDDLFRKASSESATWAATIAVNAISPMIILSREGDRVTINRGEQAGLHEGQAFKVWVDGQPEKDPVSGEMIDGDPKTLGKIMITEIFPKKSYARVLEDKGIVIRAKLSLLK